MTAGGADGAEGMAMAGGKRAVSWYVAGVAVVLLVGCGRGTPAPPTRPTPEVTAVTVNPRDIPVTFEFVAQTQSSQSVNIQARVSGFLD
ncbi:MAG: hypothetical protein ACM32F_11160, partial [Betaproteobacteria bacterium]